MKKEKDITILLVEDEAISVIAEKSILEKNGYSVITASTGEEALEAISGNEKIDIVLMDIDLGEGMDGIKAAELILKKRNLPVLFLTSHTEPDILNETGTVISYGFVLKKTGAAVLLASIETALRLFEANRYIEKQKIELASGNARLRTLVEELEAMNEEFEAMNDELVGSNRLLAEKEEEYRLLFENSSSGIVIAQDGIVRMINPALADIVDYPADEIVSRSFTDFIHPEDAGMVIQRHIARLRGDDVETDYSFRIITSHGVVKWVNLRSALIIWNQKPASLNYVVDITESKLAERDLMEREETFRALAENSIDVIMRFDRGYRHLYVNPIAERITGIPRDLFIGKTHEELGFPEELCKLWEGNLEKVFKTGEICRIEFQMPDGTWIDWLLMPEFDENKNVKAVITSARDITERKLAEEQQRKLQEQLAQANKMESVGRLAGGVAHDFNNMLGVILGNTELALQSLKGDDPVYDDLVEIKKAAERSAELTRQLLAFARRQTAAPRVLDLNETVSGMLNMLRRLIGENIELRWEPGDIPVYVKLDPAQVDQALANLCVNARDAIAGIGKISIRTKGMEIDRNENPGNSGSADFPEGKYVMLEVEDNGCGMDKNVLDNLFEPFFTTKGAGQGTGLGLATVYGIVKQNDGFIKVESEPGKGTAIKLFLPAYEGEMVSAASASFVTAQDKSDETILLVEDEISILNVTVKMLESQGYKVLSAFSPAEALRLAGENAGEISLLMTDVIMPEMNGQELSKSILSINPGIKVLFISGYTADVIAKQGIIPEGVHFIQKPFTMQELAAKVREVLSPVN